MSVHIGSLPRQVELIPEEAQTHMLSVFNSMSLREKIAIYSTIKYLPDELDYRNLPLGLNPKEIKKIINRFSILVRESLQPCDQGIY